MQKITINELIDFRRRSDKTKKNLADKLKNRKPKIKDKSEDKNDSARNYWITSNSCICNVFKENNIELYDLKVNALRSRLKDTTSERTKVMYQRNIDILNNFKDFELGDLKPAHSLKYEKVPRSYQILTIDSFPLSVKASVVFSYSKKGESSLGALWLIPRLKGFNKSELGMFCETLYKFLIKNYSKNYQISKKHCIAIDTYNAQKVAYSELLKGDIPFLIEKTLNEIKGL